MDHVRVPVALLDDLGSALSLAEVLQAFTPWLLRAVNADRSSIALLTDDGENLDLWAMAGDQAIRVGSTIPLSQSLTGTALVGDHVVFTNDLALSSAAEAKTLLDAGLRSTLNVPFKSAGRPLGIVNFGHSQPHYFDEHHVDKVRGLIQLLASHVAVHAHVTQQTLLAHTDDLTGVLGRRAVLRHLKDVIAQAGDDGAATLYVDLNGFKQINDTYGHGAGDKVLKELSQRFAMQLRPRDIIGRLGGDEFLVVLEPGTTEEGLMVVARRLHDVTAAPIDLGLSQVTVRSSIGAAMTTSTATTATEMLFEADLAMYQAKRTATPIVIADETISQQATLIAAIDRDVEAAMENGQLIYHYQPIRQLQDLEILGIEALVRWFHPEHGPVPPPLLVERIERIGLLAEFTRWTLNTAGTDLLRLRSLAPAFADKSTSINLTSQQLGWTGYPEAHAAMLATHGLRSVDIILEVVESGLIEVGTAAERNVRLLSERGSNIALDDFGTGHNVLGYFAQFPVDAIKFDRSLIESMTTSDRVRSMIRGLSQVAHELGIYTLAEGIEREEQVRLSMELGIVKGQGYLLGRPMSLERVADLINREFGARSDPEANRVTPAASPTG